jgi:hypothetical protein
MEFDLLKFSWKKEVKNGNKKRCIVGYTKKRRHNQNTLIAPSGVQKEIVIFILFPKDQ